MQLINSHPDYNIKEICQQIFELSKQEIAPDKEVLLDLLVKVDSASQIVHRGWFFKTEEEKELDLAAKTLSHLLTPPDIEPSARSPHSCSWKVTRLTLPLFLLLIQGVSGFNQASAPNNLYQMPVSFEAFNRTPTHSTQIAPIFGEKKSRCSSVEYLIPDTNYLTSDPNVKRLTPLEAVEQGDLRSLRAQMWLRGSSPDDDELATLAFSAIKFRNTEILSHLIDPWRFSQDTLRKLANSVQHGDVESMQVLLHNSQHLSLSLISDLLIRQLTIAAAERGDVGIFQVLSERNEAFSYRERDWNYVAQSVRPGEVDMMRAVLETRQISDACRSTLAISAAERGDIPMFRVLLENRSIPKYALYEAARSVRFGDLDTLRVVLESGLAEDSHYRGLLAVSAAKRGDIAMLLTLLDNGPISSIYLIDAINSIQPGDIDTAKVLLENNPVDQFLLLMTIEKAAKQRDLPLLHLLLESDLISAQNRGLMIHYVQPGDAHVMQAILKSGPIELSEYTGAILIQNAARCGDIGIIRMLLKSTSISAETRGDMAKYVEPTDVDMTRTILEIGPIRKDRLEELMEQAAERRDFPSLELLLKKGPISKKAQKILSDYEGLPKDIRQLHKMVKLVSSE